MNTEDFEFLRTMLRRRSGLVICTDRQYLVENRLLPIARRLALGGVGELIRKLREGDGDGLIDEVVEAMATKESFFFRDKIPFEHFRETMVPALVKARAASRRLRIWCAAAATGQEPYSIAMLLSEMGPRLDGWSIEIIATDLSSAELEKARAGIYNQFEVQRGLPITLLVKYFTRHGENWEIAPAVRAMVQFRTLNLLGELAYLGMFDVVFCRNVLLYFDQQTKAAVLDSVGQITQADGFLVLGAAETVVGLSDSFRPVVNCRGLYAPVAPAERTARRPAGAPMLRVVAAR